MAEQNAPMHRREVMINGNRVRVIDMHAHCCVPEANALAGLSSGWTALHAATYRARLEDMDRLGIDIEALSINPFWYGADRDLASEIVRLQNEKLAEFCALVPDRFVGLASVALQHPDLAAAQLEDGVRRHNLRGALIGGSVEGEELSDPKFEPFWAKAEDLGVVIFIHPQGTAELEQRLRGNGMLENVIGNPLETTIALSHLIFEGTLDRHPGVKILAAHGGGYLPSYAARSDAGPTTFPARFTPTAKQPTEYLKQLYYDSLVFTPEGLRHLVAEVGSSQVVVGTDYPYPWTSTPVDHVLATPGLADAEQIAILGGTAAKLLGISDSRQRPGNIPPRGADLSPSGDPREFRARHASPSTPGGGTAMTTAETTRPTTAFPTDAEVDAYLDRLGYRGSRAATLETLRGMHRAHFLSVPFENLDIGRGVRISLDARADFDKIVTRRRGGFCLELSATFARVLRGLGFSVDVLGARVFNEGRLGAPLSHMTLLVHLDEPWIADVGFGGLVIEPLHLGERAPQLFGERSYVVANDDDHYLVTAREPGGAPTTYVFTLQPRQFSEFDAVCDWLQTSPQSRFTRGDIVSLGTERGRISVGGDRLIVTEGEDRHEALLRSEAERRQVLRERFGLEI